MEIPRKLSWRTLTRNLTMRLVMEGLSQTWKPDETCLALEPDLGVLLEKLACEHYCSKSGNLIWEPWQACASGTWYPENLGCESCLANLIAWLGTILLGILENRAPESPLRTALLGTLLGNAQQPSLGDLGNPSELRLEPADKLQWKGVTRTGTGTLRGIPGRCRGTSCNLSSWSSAWYPKGEALRAQICSAAKLLLHKATATEAD